MCNESCRSCGFIEFTAGIVIGIITFLLLNGAIITTPAYIVYTALLTAVFSAFFLAVISTVNATGAERRLARCLKRNALCIAIGIAGCVIFSAAALAVSAGITVLFNVAVAVSALFGIATLISTLRLIVCLAGDNN